MQSTRKPRWQQVTALISLSTAGAMTGLAFTHGTAGDLTSPSSIPVKLLAATAKAGPATTGDSALRAAIVKSAQYYLRLAQTQSPAQIEALIWQNDSVDGADHGESCAAFASLTLESGSQAVGQQSWVSGGSTYPWALHQWVDARVDPNPASLNIISVLQDAQAHGRWHSIGDGYTPQPGDWVLFDEHVEVVTKYADGVLYTIGGDSLPNFSVNAHQYDGSLAVAGVAGFVNNGDLDSAVSPAFDGTTGSASTRAGASAGNAAAASAEQVSAKDGQASVPGLVTPSLSLGSGAQASTAQAQSQPSGSTAKDATASANATPAAGTVTVAGTTAAGAASIPGGQPVSANVTSYSSAPASASAASSASASTGSSGASGSSSARYSRSQSALSTEAVSDSTTQQAFINAVAPGALAAQKQYGIPAAVTIAQAIDESGWGQSLLATQDNNLFGIKGSGPAGSVLQPTEEFINGESVTITAPFRAYSNVAQSVLDHSVLLATGSSYKQAMADRRSPDAFAKDLTGVYATDPNYGSSLIALMRQYNLYRFDASTSQASSGTATAQGTTAAGSSSQAKAAQSGSTQSGSVQGSSAQSSSAPSSAGRSAAIPGAAESDVAMLGTASRPAAGQAAVSGGTAVAGSAQGAAGTSSPGPTGTPTAGTSSSGPTGTPTAGTSSSGPTGTPTAGTSSSGPAETPTAGTSSSGPAETPTAGTSSSGPAETPTAGTSSSGPAETPTAGTSSSGPAETPTAGTSSSGPAETPTAGTSSSGPAGTPTAGSSAAGQANPGANTGSSGSASIPGVLDAYAGAAAKTSAATSADVKPAGGQALRAGPSNVHVSTRRYVAQVPRIVTTGFITSAKTPLLRAKPIYQDVAANHGIRWELLAACDWMQCQAKPGLSPVYGEALSTKNPDGTIYRSKSEALEQVAGDLLELAVAVYGIDLRQRLILSVRELASVFAAFRWGGLLRAHRVSAMEFPYSVAGLTAHHVKMRWPDIAESAPDKPGTRFRKPFGAVPVVLGLGYPATA